MRITIRAGIKEGKTTVGAAIARILMEHGIGVIIEDDDDWTMLQLAQNPARMGLQLRSLAESKVTIVTEQIQRDEKS